MPVPSLPTFMLAPADAAPWRANLDLWFDRDTRGTVLVRRRHSGPLQVQKALYPEGSAVCHVTILHPPGGMVGGDRLQISASGQGGSHALLTTPGAGKWYRSVAGRAEQRLRFELQDDAILEWLPRENILFDASQACMSLDVHLSARARFLGWEILCFGRRACGEQWRHGSLQLDTRVLRAGRALWIERAVLNAGGGFAASAAGLAGCSVSATFLAAGFEAQPDLLQACRELAVPGDASRRGLTWIPGVLLARYLGDSSEDVFLWFSALWSLLRPRLLGRAATRPRLWAC